MQNVLGTCAAVAVLAGGFALTGDLAWLLGRGMAMSAIRATDVSAGLAVAPAVEGTPASVAPRPAATTPAPRVVGPDRIDLASTTPGQRILLWVDAAADPVAVDVVDPATAAVILHAGPPRRAMLAGGAVVRGAPLRIVAIGFARGGDAGAVETLGTVTGIAATSGR